MISNVDATLCSCSIHFDYSGGNFLAEEVKVRYRRPGKTWRQAASLIHQTAAPDKFSGSIMRLAPGTTYEIECSRPTQTETRTITTRPVPKVPAKRVIPVAAGSSLVAIEASAQPGDRFELASGTYALQVTKSGTADNLIMWTAAPGATVRLSAIGFVTGTSNVWLDGMDLGSPTARIKELLNFGTRTHSNLYFTRLNCYQTSDGYGPGSHLPGACRDITFLDCTFDGGKGVHEWREFTTERPTGPGVVVGFSEIRGFGTSKVNDAWSGGQGNNDIHNTWVWNTSDDPIELDNKGGAFPHGANIRIWNNVFGPTIGPSALSLDKQFESPFYLVGNQATGMNLSGGIPNQLFKSSGVTPGNVVMGNTFVAEASKNLSVLGDSDDLFNRDSVFTNNLWADNSPKYSSGTAAHYLLEGPTPEKNHRYWNHNLYDLAGSKNLYKWGNLATHQTTLGVEQQSAHVIITDVANNVPTERLVGTDRQITPKDMSLTRGAPKDAFLGFENLAGPYFGDVGAVQRELGPNPVGPRKLYDGVMLSLPSVAWVYEGNGKFTNGRSTIQITYEQTPNAWDIYDQAMGGTLPANAIKAEYRDGLGGISQGGVFSGWRVDDGGITRISGNGPDQQDMFHILQSLWYEWRGVRAVVPPPPPPPPPNKPPNAEAGEDQTVELGTIVYFAGSASTDPDGEIVSYVWDFGDGDGDVGQTVDHVYANSGTYTVALVVTDNEGATGTDTITVVVTELPPPPPPKKIRITGTGTITFDGDFTIIEE